MRKKELRLLVTFQTATDALAAEKIFGEAELPGRLIPVPSAITAGCGLAWSSALSDRRPLEMLLQQNKLYPQEIQEFLL